MLDFVLRMTTRFPFARWAPIPLRLIVGYGFIEHGYAKLSKGPDTLPEFSRPWVFQRHIS